jgi:hypothetical protein
MKQHNSEMRDLCWTRVAVLLPQIRRIKRRFLDPLNEAGGGGAGVRLGRWDTEMGWGRGSTCIQVPTPLKCNKRDFPLQPHPPGANHHSIKIKLHQLFTILCNFILTKPWEPSPHVLRACIHKTMKQEAVYSGSLHRQAPSVGRSEATRNTNCRCITSSAEVLQL